VRMTDHLVQNHMGPRNDWSLLWRLNIEYYEWPIMYGI